MDTSRTAPPRSHLEFIMAQYSHDPHCIFCKISAGQIPCHKIREDELTLAFLDIGPLSRGHSLVIPKGHWERLDDMPGEVIARCAAVAGELGPRIARVVDAPGWNLLQNNGPVAGQVVMHVHFHLIPRRDGDALGFRWPAGTLGSDEAQALLALIHAQA
jgi:histidine triad (HIT) family protein